MSKKKKTERHADKIKQYISSGKKSTQEIFEYINRKTKWGITANQLGSILKSSKFTRIGAGKNAEWEIGDEENGKE